MGVHIPHGKGQFRGGRRPIVKIGTLSRELCKTAEPIEMPFGVHGTQVGQSTHVLDEGGHCRHLANTTEPFMYGGDAAFLSNYFDHLLALLGLVVARWSRSTKLLYAGLG